MSSSSYWDSRPYNNSNINVMPQILKPGRQDSWQSERGRDLTRRDGGFGQRRSTRNSFRPVARTRSFEAWERSRLEEVEGNELEGQGLSKTSTRDSWESRLFQHLPRTMTGNENKNQGEISRPPTSHSWEESDLIDALARTKSYEDWERSGTSQSHSWEETDVIHAVVRTKSHEEWERSEQPEQRTKNEEIWDSRKSIKSNPSSAGHISWDAKNKALPLPPIAIEGPQVARTETNASWKSDRSTASFRPTITRTKSFDDWEQARAAEKLSKRARKEDWRSGSGKVIVLPAPKIKSIENQGSSPRANLLPITQSQSNEDWRKPKQQVNSTRNEDWPLPGPKTIPTMTRTSSREDFERSEYQGSRLKPEDTWETRRAAQIPSRTDTNDSWKRDRKALNSSRPVARTRSYKAWEQVCKDEQEGINPITTFVSMRGGGASSSQGSNIVSERSLTNDSFVSRSGTAATSRFVSRAGTTASFVPGSGRLVLAFKSVNTTGATLSGPPPHEPLAFSQQVSPTSFVPGLDDIGNVSSDETPRNSDSNPSLTGVSLVEYHDKDIQCNFDEEPKKKKAPPVSDGSLPTGSTLAILLVCTCMAIFLQALVSPLAMIMRRYLLIFGRIRLLSLLPYRISLPNSTPLSKSVGMGLRTFSQPVPFNFSGVVASPSSTSNGRTCVR
jgi:hypothetical protein